MFRNSFKTPLNALERNRKWIVNFKALPFIIFVLFFKFISIFVARNFNAMENRLDYLERSVEDTDKKLETLSWKMERWERAVSEVSLVDYPTPQQESEQQSCVLNLLQDVTQVREDYEQLRSDITEIQQLQKELSQCLRSQLNQVHAKYGFLRSKLGPALPSGLMMSTNTYPSPVKRNGIVDHGTSH